ncbi:MAG: hypothetical protein WCX64_00900 [Candidatus Micrarchaeia archaeon]
MDNAIDGGVGGSDDSTSAASGDSGAADTIDSVDGRPTLPFSVAALVVSFALLYFTPLLTIILGAGNPSFELDPATKLIVAAFLSFGIGILWEYIF